MSTTSVFFIFIEKIMRNPQRKCWVHGSSRRVCKYMYLCLTHLAWGVLSLTKYMYLFSRQNWYHNHIFSIHNKPPRYVYIYNVIKSMWSRTGYEYFENNLRPRQIWQSSLSTLRDNSPQAYTINHHINRHVFVFIT